MDYIDYKSDSLRQYFDEQQNYFSNVEELEILESNSNMLSKHSEIFRMFINIKSLIVRTDNEDLNSFLEDCLEAMANLRTITLDTKAGEAPARYNTIIQKGRDIQEVYVDSELYDEARRIFRANRQITVQMLPSRENP